MTTRPDNSSELWNPDRQAMDPQTLAAHQRAGLEQAWRRVWEDPIPFYRDKFEAAGLSADEMPPLDQIPMTIKDELRADDAARPPWGTWRALSVEQATCIGASTGTTGKPMVYLRGADDMNIYNELTRRNLWREQLRPQSRMTTSWPGFIYGAMGMAALNDFPAMNIPVGPPFSVDMAKEHIALWQMLRPTNFMMTSSQLYLYDQAAAEMGTTMAEIFNGGHVAFLEALCQYDGPREQLEKQYNMHIYNISGASEMVGAMVTDCRYHTGFHTAAEYVIAQICDPETGREVPEGGRGHLVWTAIGGNSLWMRYNVEDWAEHIPGDCPCGETGLRYRLLGREGDRQEINGTQIFPLDVQLAVNKLGAPELMVEKGKKPDVLCVKVETAGDGSDIAEVIRQALKVPVEVTPVPVDSLPRSTFKPKRS